jgi:2-oxoglutarate ferredoxin oxidoreductase subunit gamma
MTERIIIAGSGGQGIMLLGKVLAEAAMQEDKFVTWLPAYGAEVRGGTAHCMVMVCDKEIGSPYIDKADTLVIMNQPSLEKFKRRLINKGLLLVNSSLAGSVALKGARIFMHPFTEMALNLGNIKVANVIALGCLIAKSKIVNLKSVLAAISAMAPKDKKGLIEINHQALMEGAKLQ